MTMTAYSSAIVVTFVLCIGFCCAANVTVLTSPSGSITNRINPVTNNYDKYADDKWIINVTSFVRIKFNKLLLRKDDSVILYDATEFVANDRMRGIARANQIESQFVLQGPVLVRFLSNSSTAEGFNLTYSTADTEGFTMPTQIVTFAQKPITNDTRLVLLMSHPKTKETSIDYPNNYTKSWQLVVMPNQTFNLIFSKVDIKSPGDTLTVYSGLHNDPQNRKPIFKYSSRDSNLKEVTVTHTDNVTVVFTTDGSGTGKGFIMVDIPIVTLSFPSGYIPNRIGSKFLQYIDDIWVINVTSFVRVTIKTNNLPYFSFLILYDTTDAVSNNRIRAVVNKFDFDSEYVLQGPVVIRFKSKYGSLQNPFNLTYTTADTADFTMPTIIDKSKQNRNSDNMPIHHSHSSLIYKDTKYPNNYTKAWQFLVAPNQNFNLIFSRLDIKSPGDTLAVYSGLQYDPQNRKPIFNFSSRDSNVTQMSLTHTENVTVVFRTDGSGTDEGFSITDIPVVTVTSPSGSISSHSKSVVNKLYTIADDLWLINVTSNVRIKFEKLDIEPYFAAVRLYNATFAVASDKLAATLRKGQTDSEFLLQGPVLVRFTSFSYSTKDMFKLVYTDS